MRPALLVRESVHFLPPDFIKRRFSGLSLEDHCCTGTRGKANRSAPALPPHQYLYAQCYTHTVSTYPHGPACAVWNCLSCSGLFPLLLMKDIFSFGESRGVQDSPYHLHHSDPGLALIGVNTNPPTDCQLNNLTFKWQKCSKGYSPTRS